jgi:hypothetical protein
VVIVLASETDFLSDFQSNNRWIIENYDELKKQYSDQWIAVLSKTVVDHDPDLKKLVKRLKANRIKVYNQIAVEHVSSEEAEVTLKPKETFTDSFF